MVGGISEGTTDHSRQEEYDGDIHRIEENLCPKAKRTDTSLRS